jgi:Asp-tRNAAsn/Glu-tRNAGln amidotransferase A subunit and related amidases
MFASHVGREEQANYYRWLALTYVVTLCTNPAVTLPCGIDEAGMPFGLQVIGPFRRDGSTLDIAQAMEKAFASSHVLRRPRPDLRKLANAVIEPALKSIVTALPRSGIQSRLDCSGMSLV